MKKNVMLAAVLLFLFAQATTVFSESASSGPAANVGVLMLQQQLKAVQMSMPDAVAAENVEAVNIEGTWKGASPTMLPDGTCTTRPVVVTITHQCGNLVKGSIQALGVTVPVEGEFNGNYLSFIGTKAGTPSWIASILATYALATKNFTVMVFLFEKTGLVLNNVYDTGWKLNKQ